ncbi:MAG: site-specific integrase, partial [Bacillota bacterium]|nr:site-specific integrase [Bacillota bacterium]
MADKRKHRKRANQAGSVYRRADGYWVASLSLGYDENGKAKRRTLYGATKAEVETRLLEAMHAHRTGLMLDPATETVKQFLDRWLRDSVKNSVRPLTYQSYEVNVRRHIVPPIGQVLLRQLTPAHIQGLYVQKLRDGLSPRSVQYMAAILGRALRQAVRWELIPRNPAEAADKPRVQRNPMPALSADEARKLLAAAQGDRLEALFILTTTTGMRIGEVLGLTRDSVDLQRERLLVTQQLQKLPKEPPTLVAPKTAQSRRVIALSPMVVSSLKRH